jgi:hypothetical protein
VVLGLGCDLPVFDVDTGAVDHHLQGSQFQVLPK